MLEQFTGASVDRVGAATGADFRHNSIQDYLRAEGLADYVDP